MENTSIFLAKFWGWYIIVFVVLLIINPKRIKQLITYIEDDRFLVLTSFLAIIIGLLAILAHNIWTSDWRVVVTLFGWIALLKGIIRFAFPSASLKTINKLNIRWMPYMIVFMFVVGVFLLNKAYEIVPF